MKHPRPALLSPIVATTVISIVGGAGGGSSSLPPPVAEAAFTCPPAGAGGGGGVGSIIRPGTIPVAPARPSFKTGNDGRSIVRGTNRREILAPKTTTTPPPPIRHRGASPSSSYGYVSPPPPVTTLSASVATSTDGGTADGYGSLRSKMRRLTTAALSVAPAAIASVAARRESLSNAARGAARSVSRTVRRSISIPKTRRESTMRLLRKLGTATGTILRLLRILGLAAPVALTYPLARRSRSKQTYERWLKFCLRQSERGGAVIIKLCQWASSRPDIFGTDFCAVFGRLQDGTTPHPWGHTDRVLREAYGEDYGEHLRVEKHDEVLGSGCIAQVYKGTITDDDEHEGLAREVAIKVIHPNVREGMDHDLNVLRLLAKYLERLPFGYGERLRWNNLSGMVEEFARMLRPQLDLRNEASHLTKFNRNFRDDPNVVFPNIVEGYDAHRDVLVETFCEGVPVERYCREHASDDLYPEIRVALCDLAARTMCRMVFEHNFVHGDLHPGNIYVTPDGKKLVLLDCGIVNEYDDDDHDLIVNIIAAFIRMDGRRAAELMTSDSERRLRLAAHGDDDGVEGASSSRRRHSRDVDRYVERIELLSKTPRKSDFAFEKVTTYANYIFNAAAEHRVLMNPTFVSFVMAVKVQEGVALMLNPSFELIRVANPIILRCEANRLRERGFDTFVRQLLEDAWRDWRVRLGQARRVAPPEEAEKVGGGGGGGEEDDLFPPALKPAVAA